jgi:hypothetical protein
MRCLLEYSRARLLDNVCDISRHNKKKMQRGSDFSFRIAIDPAAYTSVNPQHRRLCDQSCAIDAMALSARTSLLRDSARTQFRHDFIIDKLHIVFYAAKN